MRRIKTLLLCIFLGMYVSSFLYAEAQSVSVKGGDVQTVDFKSFAEASGYSISVSSATNWKFSEGFDIYGNNGWLSVVDTEYMKSASTTVIFATEAFPITLSGTILPTGGGKGAPPSTDWTVRGNFLMGTPSITPMTAYIPFGETLDFSYFLDDTAVQAYWGYDGANWTESSSATYTFPPSLTFNTQRFPIQARLNDKDVGQVTAEAYYVKIGKISIGDKVSSTTQAPGENETLIVPVSDEKVTIEATKVPEDAPEWPENCPKWTSNGGEVGTKGESSYEFTPSNAGIYTIGASCGTDSKALKIICISAKLQYRIGESGEFKDFEDYNGDGDGDLIIPYYDMITTMKDALAYVSNKKIKVYFKLTMPSSLANCFSDISWENANVTSDTAIASKEFSDIASTKIMATLDGVYDIFANVHVVKVNFSPGGGHKYGFDYPYLSVLDDYDAYVSLKKDDIGSIVISISPQIPDLEFYAMTLNKNIFTFQGKSEQKISSNSVSIKGEAPTAERNTTNLVVYVKNKNSEKSNYTFPTSLKVKLYDEKLFHISLYRIGVTEAFDKAKANAIFAQIVYRIGDIREKSFTSNNDAGPDINGNSYFDYYYGDYFNPEEEKLSEKIVLDETKPVILVKEIKTNYRVTVTSIDTSSKKVFFKPVIQANVLRMGNMKYSLCTETSNGTERNVFASGVSIYPGLGSGEYYYYYTTNNLNVKGALTLIAEQTVVSGLNTISAKGVVVPLYKNGEKRKNLENLIVHELGHFVANLKDTDVSKKPGGRITIMQYADDGIHSSDFFSCRKVERVVTGSGDSYNVKEYESHWDRASR